MAKIGTAHIEIKPVIDEVALKAIEESVARAVAAGVARGMQPPTVPDRPATGQWWPSAPPRYPSITVTSGDAAPAAVTTNT